MPEEKKKSTTFQLEDVSWHNLLMSNTNACFYGNYPKFLVIVLWLTIPPVRLTAKKTSTKKICQEKWRTIDTLQKRAKKLSRMALFCKEKKISQHTGSVGEKHQNHTQLYIGPTQVN